MILCLRVCCLIQLAATVNHSVYQGRSESNSSFEIKRIKVKIKKCLIYTFQRAINKLIFHIITFEIEALSKSVSKYLESGIGNRSQVYRNWY